MTFHNFSIIVNMADSDRIAKETFQKFQNIVGKFLDTNLTFVGSIPRTKKIQNAIIRKLPIVLDKEAELESLAFQRLSKNVIKAEKIDIMVYAFSQEAEFTI